MRKEYDVVIVGGGPAGSVFAKELAGLLPGRRILLIDGQTPKNPKVCGGLLAPDAQRMFAMLGLTLPTEILSDPQIFDVETIDLQKKQVRYYQRHYLNMDRYAFDKWLISLIPPAVDVGVGRCEGIRKESDGYQVNVNINGQTEKILTRYLVGADGASSVVRRTLFGKGPKKYVAIQQHFPCSHSDLPPYSCIFDPETSDSCSWTIRKDGYIVFGGAFEPKGCREAFEAQKARLETFLQVSFGEPSKTEACQVTSPRKRGDLLPGRDRVLLLGEAAGFISASSFEGISSAVLSARLLAEAFAEGYDSDRVLPIYRKKTRKLRGKLCGKMQKRRVLCSPFLRWCIMKSGIQSMEKYHVPSKEQKTIIGESVMSLSEK